MVIPKKVCLNQEHNFPFFLRLDNIKGSLMHMASGETYRRIIFFFFIEHRLSTPVGTPNLSMHVKIQPTYLTLGVDFCVYGPYLSHRKGNHTPTLGSCTEILEKRQIEDHRR